MLVLQDTSFLSQDQRQAAKALVEAWRQNLATVAAAEQQIESSLEQACNAAGPSIAPDILDGVEELLRICALQTELDANLFMSFMYSILTPHQVAILTGCAYPLTIDWHTVCTSCADEGQPPA